MRTIKNNFLYIVFLLAFGLIGGYFTTLYSIETMPEESLNEAIAQVGSVEAVVLITALQTALIYSLLLGSIGKFFAEKIGTWRDFSFESKPLVSVLLVSLIGGAAMIFADRYGFGAFNQQIADGYLAKPTLNYFLASITYGGVIEEIMIRLFVMSLLAFAFMKISKNTVATDKNLILANIISSVLFAAGHLPSTAMTIGLDALIIVRCFVMNGAYGVIFGELYRKYGIGYAMLAHAGVHIVSKAIWWILI